MMSSLDKLGNPRARTITSGTKVPVIRRGDCVSRMEGLEDLVRAMLEAKSNVKQCSAAGLSDG